MEDQDWIDRLASQYGARNMASLRGNIEQYQAADLWLRMIASDHWHDIIAALRGVRPTSTYVNRCAHEWYQGRCTHCDIKAVDGRPEQPDKVGIAGKP